MKQRATSTANHPKHGLKSWDRKPFVQLGQKSLKDWILPSSFIYLKNWTKKARITKAHWAGPRSTPLALDPISNDRETEEGLVCDNGACCWTLLTAAIRLTVTQTHLMNRTFEASKKGKKRLLW